MVRYSDELLDEIRTKNDIVDVVSGYVGLKRSGRNYIGLCPFHNEKSPSFFVSPDKQIFKCFGCNIGGNVFRFISKIEDVGFRESVEILANRANVVLPESTSSEEEDKMYYLRSKVYEINKIAAEFYHQNLYNPNSKEAQEYVKKRKLDNKTLKTFLLGYSGKYNELYNVLKNEGFKEEEILASDLVYKNQQGEFIDAFRRRLMFPIQDEHGKIIAFGGRSLLDGDSRPKNEPKYRNSSDTIVYNKGRHLYGLYAAKKDKPKKILIVEGYMDTISLHQRGITNVVASLGTAMTEAQGRLLRNSCEQVIIGYDTDGAGQAATMRGLEILKNLGCDVRILQLEGAKDPDEYIIENGPERFKRYMDNAISLIEFKIKNLKKELNLDIANDKIKFLTEIAKELALITNSIEQEVYIEKIALDYKISKEAIYAEINKIVYAKENGNKKLEKKNTVVKPRLVDDDDSKINSAIIKRENLVIYLLVNYPEEAYQNLKDNIKIEEIKSSKNKEIIQKLYEELEKGNTNTTSILNVFNDEDVIDHLSGIMATDFEITEVKKCIEDVIVNYEKDKLIARRNDIIKKLEDTSELTKDEIANLEKELSELIIRLARMK